MIFRAIEGIRLAALCSSALGFVLPAAAQSEAASLGVVDAGSEVITVTATRTPKPVNAVPATVTVIDDKEIADRLVTDIKDLVRLEPGVSVPRAPSRFTAAGSSVGRDGNSGFNIRGLEGNRVLIQIDGIRVPDAYSFGPQAVGRGNLVDLDLLKSVEILRGPASALYGSDGVAGAVSFTTKDPADLLTGDKDWAVRLQAGYASADESYSEGAVGAVRAGDWSALVADTRRDGHELENQGTNFSSNTTRTAPNPEDDRSNAVLAKIVYAPNSANTLKLTFDHLDSRTDWDVLSARAAAVTAATSVLRLTAFDEDKRNRVSLQHVYTGESFIRSARTDVYYQESTTRQYSFEDRNTAADRTRDSTFDNRVFGLATELQSSFETGSLKHLLVYGGDFSETRQDSIRGGTVPTPPDVFPTKAFPTTDYQLLGLYVQDEISLLDGKLTFFPAIRFDYYDISPKSGDPLYRGLTPAGSSDNHFSPKLGIVWQFDDRLGAFLNLAEGFRAPAPSQVNNGFTNLAQGYQSISNPGLKPETSRTIEGGLRFKSPGVTASVAGFHGEYDDFISQEIVGGNFTPANPTLFQYINLQGVKISGVEAKAQAELGYGFGLFAGVSYTYGTSERNGVKTPLNSVDPVKITGGLSYTDLDGRFGGLLSVIHSEGKSADRVDPTACGTACFLPDSFTVLDLTAWAEMVPGVKLRGGVFNLTDETYAWWSDVRGIAATSLITDAYTQPGRNYSLSLSVSF